MTAAKLRPLGDTSGLVHSLNDRVFADLIAGRPAGTIAVVGLMVPAGAGMDKTAKGTKQYVKYEFLRLEPIRDAGEADTVAWQVTRAYEYRTGTGEQGELPLGHGSPDEERQSLLAAIAEWASETGLSEAQVADRWLDVFGGFEHASSPSPDKGTLLHLLEFAYTVGAVEDTPVGGVDDDDDDDGSEPDADEDL